MSEELENSYDSECEIFMVLFLYEHKYMERLSNIWRDCQISVPLTKLNIRRATRDGESGGDLRCPFLKIEKSALILEKRL